MKVSEHEEQHDTYIIQLSYHEAYMLRQKANYDPRQYTDALRKILEKELKN